MKRSRKNDRVRLLHMRDSASNAIKFVRGMSREDFESDLKTRHAVERATEIVGEAASNITDELQQRHSEIDWRDIKGMRIHLAHAYHRINLDVLWRAATIEFPILIEQLEAILADETT